MAKLVRGSQRDLLHSHTKKTHNAILVGLQSALFTKGQQIEIE